MTDPKIRLYKYELPLLSNFPRELSTNLCAEGYILQIELACGYKAFGEMSRASLQTNESFLLAKAQLREAAVLEDWASDKYYPPVRWAVSSAKKQVELFKKGQGFFESIGQESVDVISVNALLDASSVDFVDDGIRCHTQGFKVLKIKIGDGKIEDEIARIRELVSIIGHDLVIRFDANQKMSIFHAVEFVRSLKKVRIEYFEEPFEDLDSLDEFFRLTGMRVALDETLQKIDNVDWIRHEAVGAYVIKPSRVGCESRVLSLIAEATQKKRDFVISSTFESGLGLSVLAQYAFVRQEKDVAMGLATGLYFASDVLTPPIRYCRGKLMRENVRANVQKVNLDGSSFCDLL